MDRARRQEFPSRNIYPGSESRLAEHLDRVLVVGSVRHGRGARPWECAGRGDEKES